MIINPDEPVVLTYSNDWLSLKHCSDDSQSLTGREAHELPRRRRYSAALALPTCCSAWQGDAGVCVGSQSALTATLAGLAFCRVVSDALVRSLTEANERDAGRSPYW